MYASLRHSRGKIFLWGKRLSQRDIALTAPLATALLIHKRIFTVFAEGGEYKYLVRFERFIDTSL